MSHDTSSPALAAKPIQPAAPLTCAFCGQSLNEDVRMRLTAPEGEGGVPEEISAPSCAACRSAAGGVVERLRGTKVSADTLPDYRVALEMLIRGLWFHEQGSVLPPAVPIAVEQLIGDPETLLFAGFQRKVLGVDVECWHIIDRARPGASLWAFRFPADQYLMGATGVAIDDLRVMLRSIGTLAEARVVN